MYSQCVASFFLNKVTNCKNASKSIAISYSFNSTMHSFAESLSLQKSLSQTETDLQEFSYNIMHARVCERPINACMPVATDSE